MFDPAFQVDAFQNDAFQAVLAGNAFQQDAFMDGAWQEPSGITPRVIWGGNGYDEAHERTVNRILKNQYNLLNIVQVISMAIGHLE